MSKYFFSVHKIEAGTVLARMRPGDQTPLVMADEELWGVSLPHQCDRWQIVSHGLSTIEGGSWAVDEAPLQDAITQMREFIEEAQAALRRLELTLADSTRSRDAR